MLVKVEVEFGRIFFIFKFRKDREFFYIGSIFFFFGKDNFFRGVRANEIVYFFRGGDGYGFSIFIRMDILYSFRSRL